MGTHMEGKQSAVGWCMLTCRILFFFSLVVFLCFVRRRLSPAALTMKGDACISLRKHCITRFGIEFDSNELPELRKLLTDVLTQIKDGGLQTSVITLEQVDLALAALASNGSELMSKKVIDVIGAFDMPRFHYDTVRKTFHPVQHERSKFGLAEEKAEMLRTRYELLLQRLQRLPAFQTNANQQQQQATSSRMIDDGESEPTEIVTIESLMGTTGKKCIFGQLSQLTEGVYSLEDIHSSVTLNLNSPSLMLSSGLFTEGCLVLCEGSMKDDGTFHVETLISPPAETKLKTIMTFPQLDYLESDLTHAKRIPELRLKQQLLESSEHANDMIVMLSDVHLDKPQVLEKLSTMLEGLASSIPPAFVFCGNFTSRPFSNAPGEMARLKGCFDALADLLSKFPVLTRESHFIFIPGPGDLSNSMASILPTPSLPEVFTRKLKEKLLHCTFGTNPCRISWITKELVFFREDLLHKMRRNCIRPPSEAETTDISQHLVKTVIDQAHLSPLIMEKRPIFWNFDHALRLYPLPDVLIMADCVDQYEWPYEGVKAINPGTFAHDYSFVVYFPAQDKAEFSRC